MLVNNAIGCFMGCFLPWFLTRRPGLERANRALAMLCLCRGQFQFYRHSEASDVASTKNLRRADTQSRYASGLSMHSDTQAVPASTVYECLKASLRHSLWLNTLTCCLPMLKQASDIFQHASIFKRRVSTRACPF